MKTLKEQAEEAGLKFEAKTATGKSSSVAVKVNVLGKGKKDKKDE